MTTQTSTRTRSIWQDTRPIVSTAKAQPKRPARADHAQPTTQPQAEQEADRWVAAMMFDHYNG
jgi:hypothetical protein